MMKKYLYEAAKTLWEKPTEPDYLFVAPAQVWVKAESEEEAKELATKKLAEEFQGSGILLGEARFVACYDLPANWGYGYGEDYRSGHLEGLDELTSHYVIR